MRVQRVCDESVVIAAADAGDSVGGGSVRAAVLLRGGAGVREGYHCTLYASGYGNDDASARQSWGVGLKRVGNAIMQLSAGGV